MIKLIKTIVLVATSVIGVGCVSTNKPSVALFPPTNIDSIPDYKDDKYYVENRKILVVPGLKSNISEYIQKKFETEIITIIIESGSEVIDRKMASRFIDEIQLKENISENYQAYEGPVEAKFVVIPTIIDISYSGEYEKSYTTKNKKGETVRHNDECDYSAKAKANVQIRELPSMKQIISFNVEGHSSTRKENPSSRSCKESSMHNVVIAGAISNLLEKGEDDYITFNKYVGSQGIITGARSFDGDLYFETSLGRLHGAKEKAPVAIYQNIDGELILVAEGEMMGANNVLRKKSYIEVDKNVAPMLKKGMTVMLSGKCVGYMCAINSTLRTLR